MEQLNSDAMAQVLAIMLIAVTGYDSAEDQRLTQQSGFDVHLVKPLEPSVLLTIFDEIVRSKANAGGASLLLC